MQNISPSTKSYFIYFTSYANAVLNCTKELIIALLPNSSYCEMRYYIKEDDLFDNALEILIDNALLLCCFDEVGKCDACYIHFDNVDEVSTYIKLCDIFFECCPTFGRWKLGSSFIMYFEEKGDRYLGFFAYR